MRIFKSGPTRRVCLLDKVLPVAAQSLHDVVLEEEIDGQLGVFTRDKALATYVFDASFIISDDVRVGCYLTFLVYDAHVDQVFVNLSRLWLLLHLDLFEKLLCDFIERRMFGWPTCNALELRLLLDSLQS